MTIAMIQMGQLPAVRLTAADGAEATVTFFGAHLVSWRRHDQRERIFLSDRSSLDGQRAIRGGIPVIFPQFAEHGSGMRHGFARMSTWRVADHGSQGGDVFVDLELTQDDLEPKYATAWPYAFKLMLRVMLRANELALSLDVHNMGVEAFPFSAALHSYHLVDEIATIRIDGVEHESLCIEDKIDIIYRDCAGPVMLATGQETRRLEQQGFGDVVVWNPGAADAAALPDLADDEFRRFACIEPLLLGPQTLDPGQVWNGSHRIVLAA